MAIIIVELYFNLLTEATSSTIAIRLSMQESVAGSVDVEMGACNWKL